jgi:hypothetical protein
MRVLEVETRISKIAGSCRKAAIIRFDDPAAR